MRLKEFAAALAVAAALGLLAAPADAAPKKQRVIRTVDARGNTVYISRDENGRKRTRIIIQKRSYLQPGSERFPGENSDQKYAFPVNQGAANVLDNTAFGGNQSALPGPFDLPSRHNPWMSF